MDIDSLLAIVTPTGAFLLAMVYLLRRENGDRTRRNQAMDQIEAMAKDIREIRTALIRHLEGHQ